VRNAQDATPPDGEVTLNLKTTKSSVVLFIQDNGSGMTEEFIHTCLFKPFESTKGLTGMGIGAYQAKEYIRELGGDMDVTSEPGVGSCFSIKLPLAHPDNSPSGHAKPSSDADEAEVAPINRHEKLFSEISVAKRQ